MSVSIQNLSKTYGTQKAVDAITFEVKKGEILGFLGPNGAGKTSTMKMITAYLKATEGQVLVAGYDVSKEPLEVKRRLGYLPENNPLYVDMYVKEFLQFISGLHGIKDNTQVQNTIDTVGLTQEQHKKISELSKGYKQRVGLAQAILHDPEILILDEPTTGLDPTQLVEIRKLIKELGKDKTVILSTHIMQEVENLCDKVIILNKGRIQLETRVDAIIKEGKTMEEVFLQHTT